MSTCAEELDVSCCLIMRILFHVFTLEHQRTEFPLFKLQFYYWRFLGLQFRNLFSCFDFSLFLTLPASTDFGDLGQILSVSQQCWNGKSKTGESYLLLKILNCND